jgi:hypothetical protein
MEFARAQMGDRFDVDVEDLSAVNRAMGKNWENAYIGNSDMEKRHAVEIVAEQNLKKADTFKIQKKIEAIEKQIANSIAKDVGKFDPSSLGGRGAAGRDRDRARSSEARQTLKAYADRLKAEIENRNSQQPAPEPVLTAPTRADIEAQQAQLEAERKRKEQGGDAPIKQPTLTADIPDMFNPQGSVFDSRQSQRQPPKNNR